MRVLSLLALAIVFVLSLSAGAAKIMQSPHEVEFFQRAGLGTTALLIMGALQILGAGLLISKKLRAVGALIAALCFLASVVIIMITGQIGFALVSMVPACIAFFVFIFTLKSTAKAKRDKLRAL